jgi:hypothetical protein
MSRHENGAERAGEGNNRMKNFYRIKKFIHKHTRHERSSTENFAVRQNFIFAQNTETKRGKVA